MFLKVVLPLQMPLLWKTSRKFLNLVQFVLCFTSKQVKLLHFEPLPICQTSRVFPRPNKSRSESSSQGD